MLLVSAGGCTDYRNSPEGRAAGQVAGVSTNLHKWPWQWSEAHGGRFPDEMAQVLDDRETAGADTKLVEDAARNLVAYYGKGLTNKAAGGTILMRFRVPGYPDREVRQKVDGSAWTIMLKDGAVAGR